MSDWSSDVCSSDLADQLDDLRHGGGLHHRLRVGQPDVLGGEDALATGDEDGSRAPLDQAGEPVEGGVDVGVAEALDVGREEVVVLLAALEIGRASGGEGVCQYV